MSPDGNQYDFILNPAKPPKKSIVPKPGDGSSFTKKLIFIIGGGVALIIVLWIVGSLLGGGGGNVADITKIVQQETEIARVAEEGSTASQANTKGSATNIQLTMESQQQEWLTYLAERGTEISEEQQQLLKNATTDQKLEAAKANNTFDKAFVEVMRTYLESYSSTLQTTFNNTASESERELLRSHYDQTQLLLEQLPKT